MLNKVVEEVLSIFQILLYQVKLLGLCLSPNRIMGLSRPHFSESNVGLLALLWKVIF